MLRGTNSKIYRNVGEAAMGKQLWVNVNDPNDIIHRQFCDPYTDDKPDELEQWAIMKVDQYVPEPVIIND